MRKLAALVAVGLASCGGDPVLLVEVDLSGYEVPAEVDLIHLELHAGEDQIGRNFPLEAGDQEPLFELLPGSRTPNELELVAYAYLGALLVSTSPPVPATVGEQERVRLVLP